ncbi:MAG: energy-coupling factor transporter transmembrane component T [Eubacteriales bacterium]|jgi:energy-coupling factor transport system permease protein|nr:energy-coupling factor transporter transmembrane component T [Eubacteriales bacterium]
MNANISLGQYLPGNSVVHRLDPRTKIILMAVYIAIVFVVKTLPVFLMPVVLLVAIFAFAQVPASYFFSALKPMKWLLVFMFVINLFATQGDTVWFEWKFIRLTQEAAEQAVFMTLRLVLLVAGTSVLTLTTSPIALTDGLEKLMSPLRKLRFPAHELAMMMTIALRFIPTLMEETDRIQKAQMARGADFESGNIFQRAKSMIPVLVPLFVSAFRRADELALAMESRCYHGGEGRTRMRELHFHACDLIATLLLVAFMTGIIVLEKLPL